MVGRGAVECRERPGGCGGVAVAKLRLGQWDEQARVAGGVGQRVDQRGGLVVFGAGARESRTARPGSMRP